ncbi:MAG: hypothetical protein JOZ69_14770 [Myxococcales bacterium]|nr:hypothetical protein [Myxococcales bacterium]
MRPLAITGLGVASPFGVGRGAFTEGVLASLAGAQVPSKEGSAAPIGGGLAAPASRALEIPGFDAAKYLGEKGLRSLDRLTKLLIVAARLGLHDAGLKRDGAWAAPAQPDTTGIVVSNAYGSLEAITELDRVALLEDARYINPSRFPLTVSNSAAGYASIWEDLRAVNVTVSDGNCGGIDAIACAEALLRERRAGALLVGGAEALSEALALGFEKLGALSDRARLGEGAALLVVEAPHAASARGAVVRGTVAGYGTAFEAPPRESSLVHAASPGVERAVRAALADASIGPSEVDVVVCGASGLAAFDEAELLGIRRVLGDEVCVIAPKSVLGETLGAGGALGVASCLVLFEGPVGSGSARRAGGRMESSAARASDRAPAHGALPWVRGVLRAEPRTALVTSLGYYGNASALVMRAPPR